MVTTTAVLVTTTASFSHDIQITSRPLNDSYLSCTSITISGICTLLLSLLNKHVAG